MSNADERPPLVVDDVGELVATLSGILEAEGFDGLTGYLRSELAPGRVLVVESTRIPIASLQLRQLEHGAPGEVVFQTGDAGTPTDSRLAMTVNLVDAEPPLQVVLRRSAD